MKKSEIEKIKTSLPSLHEKILIYGSKKKKFCKFHSLEEYNATRMAIFMYMILPNISISLRNLITLSTSQSLPINVFILHLILCYFLLSIHWMYSWRQYLIVSLWFLNVTFLHVDCWSFIDNKCPWVSLVCPIQSLLNLTRCMVWSSVVC